MSLSAIIVLIIAALMIIGCVALILLWAFTEELPRMGIGTSLVDPTDLAAVKSALRPETRLILIETVANPTLRIADLEGIISLGRERGILIAVDNTFTTPKLTSYY